MFKINYRIIANDYDDFIGQNGFFQIKCNGYDYGEIYPKEIEEVMEKTSLYDWFERLTRVVKNLETKEYVVLSDVESYNTWIEFEKRDSQIIISIIEAKKEQGSQDIEFHLVEAKPSDWTNQVVDFYQLKEEISRKGKEYIESVIAFNADNKTIIAKIQREFQ